MTIALCFLTPEGVVLGADSATTFTLPQGGQRYFNHAQKVFQVDDAGSLGVATYGSASLGSRSFRTVIAALGDRCREDNTRPQTVEAAAALLHDMIHTAAQQSFAAEIATANQARVLAAAGGSMTAAQLNAVRFVDNWAVGFYVGGRNWGDREPSAFHVIVRLSGAPIASVRLSPGWALNGATSIASRLLRGWDDSLIDAIATAENANGVRRWAGSTADDLRAVLATLELPVTGSMPIREAVDFVHSIVTISSKMTKFAQLPPSVGGPTEVAVITSDRPFRWVRHKAFDSAF